MTEQARALPKILAEGEARDLIDKGEYDCLVLHGGEVRYAARGRGIGPAYDACSLGYLAGAEVYDRIVGRAAALLFLRGGVKSVYAHVMSEGAKALLEPEVPISHTVLTARILNREGTGPCPMDAAVATTSDPEEAFLRVGETLRALRAGK